MASTKEKKKATFTREEEILLQDFSRNVSTKSSALFYGNAAIVSAIPVWLFWRIHQMEPLDNYIYFILGIVVATYLVARAYRNVKFVLKHKIAQKREQAVAIHVNAQLADKKLQKKDKDERVLWAKNDVADNEATTFSIFYNNCLFLIILLFASFFVFKNFQPVFNYLLSMGTAAGLLALFSTSTK